MDMSGARFGDKTATELPQNCNGAPKALQTGGGFSAMAGARHRHRSAANRPQGSREIHSEAEADVRRGLQRAREEELQGVRRVLLAAVDVPVAALGLPLAAAFQDREARAAV